MTRRRKETAHAGPTIHCEYCNGSGRAPVPPAYALTLAALDREWCTTEGLARRLGNKAPKATALCNRLVYLERHGLAIRRVSEVNARIVQWRLAV